MTIHYMLYQLTALWEYCYGNTLQLQDDGTHIELVFTGNSAIENLFIIIIIIIIIIINTTVLTVL